MQINTTEAFVKLGIEINKHLNNNTKNDNKIAYTIKQAELNNPWFVKTFIINSLESIACMLNKENLNSFSHRYNLQKHNHPSKNIGLILAGNIPLVGFQDFAHTLLSNNNVYAKLSKSDNILIPLLAEILIEIEPKLKTKIHFVNKLDENIDAVIATGSNNTARYFEHSFANIPHIIRKNRNSIAILDGNESIEQLQSVLKDIFMYFGLGCRNVSKMYVPQNYDWSNFIKASNKFSYIKQHKPYYNNYIYNKSILLINETAFIDGDFYILMPSTALQSPISIVNFEEYSNITEVKNSILSQTYEIQCIISSHSDIDNAIPLGQSQQPQIDDYADGIDTMKFLCSL